MVESSCLFPRKQLLLVFISHFKQVVGSWGRRRGPDFFWEGLENLGEVFDHRHVQLTRRAEIEIHSKVVMHNSPVNRDAIPVQLPQKQ